MTFDQKFPYCSSLSTIFRPETFSRTHERMDDCQLLSSRMVWGRIVIVIQCRIIARAKGLCSISAADSVFFQIKNYTKGEKLGCQNVIMLITDGAPDYYKEIFQLYNPDKKVYNKQTFSFKAIPCYSLQIRFFSFLIGDEATDFEQVKWMACTNKGFMVHVANLADVQEKVQVGAPLFLPHGCARASLLARKVVNSEFRKSLYRKA